MNNKIVFLGTNGWYSTNTGNTISILIDTKDYTIVLDAGDGIYKLDEFLTIKKPVYLFISHFHLDHIIGIHMLPKFKKIEKLFIYVQEDGKKILEQIMNIPYTMPIEKFNYKCEIIEANKDNLNKLPFKVEVRELLHVVKTIGFRIELENKKIAYCADTGNCENNLLLAKNADILFTECAFLPGESDKNWPHLNPESGALIAKKSNAKKLYLVHFDASRYKSIEDRKDARDTARKIFNKSYFTFDEMKIEF